MMMRLLQNADTWSYAHRVGNGELNDKQQDEIIYNSFWKLCEYKNEEKKEEKKKELQNDPSNLIET